MREALNVLVSAYACGPDQGSEPGIAYNYVRQIAKRHQVWVLTRRNNRPLIEAALAKEPLPKAHFVYFDLPGWMRFWKQGRRGLHLYYYLWQVAAYFLAKELHREVAFDLVHHVTFAVYWMPSFLVLLPAPFIWGPVGGGEAAPRSFWSGLGLRGKLHEILRSAVQTLGRADPFVRLAARRAALVFATTPETAARLRRLGCRNVEILSAMGMTSREIHSLHLSPEPQAAAVRFLSVGELLHVKGFELSLRAFAEIVRSYSASEYWIIGDGPERRRLERLARELGIAGTVLFLGAVPREQVFERLSQCHVLVHPGLHDSGALVCTEAMAAGRPVICLDLGGPGFQVTAAAGCKIAAISPEQAVQGLADAMKYLAGDPILRRRMGEAARQRVRESFSWDAKGEKLMCHYSQIHASASGLSAVDQSCLFADSSSACDPGAR